MLPPTDPGLNALLQEQERRQRSETPAVLPNSGAFVFPVLTGLLMDRLALLHILSAIGFLVALGVWFVPSNYRRRSFAGSFVMGFLASFLVSSSWFLGFRL